MSEGPTTAGSIVGKLKLDKSQWDADVAAAKGQAAELGALEPTIHVDAKIGDALAKLEAVRAAEEKLGFASDRLKIAYQKLDEVQTKGGASESRLMQLHMSAAKAESDYEKATRNLTAAKAAMATADDAAAKSTTGLGAAQAMTGATGYLVAGGIAAIIALIGPLTAATIGIAGGLTGMGAAGVLAVFGIIQAMKNGTAVGAQYAEGLAGLKDEFDQLSQTGAVALLGSFQKASDLIAQSLPNLNAEIGQFAQILGGASVSALDGVVNGFQVMNPLFVEGADLIAQIAAGFDQWTQDGGLQKFVAYAVVELPQVSRTIGLLSDDIVKLTQELTPAGDGMIKLIGDAAILLKGLQNLNDGLNGLTASWEKAGGVFDKNPVMKSLIDTVMAVLDPLGTAGKQLGNLGDAIGSLGGSSSVTAPKIAHSTQSIGDLSKATDTARSALDKFNQALQGLGQTNLSASQANIQYQQSLADTSTAIQKNGATLDLNTQAGRDNMTALDGIASSAIASVVAQQKAGASADSLSQQMASARQSFINAAMAAGDTAAQANALADQYGLIPKDVSTAFTTSGAQAAIAAADAVKAAYDRINKQITIRVNSIMTNAALNPNGMGLGTGGVGKADGGTIGMSSGGSVRGPGTAFSDTAGLYRLANGEEVISNKSGQADRWRPVLKAINAGQSPAIAASQSAPQQDRNEPIYADGVGLIGWVRQVAGQQAELVFNQGLNKAAQQLGWGSTV